MRSSSPLQRAAITLSIAIALLTTSTTPAHANVDRWIRIGTEGFVLFGSATVIQQLAAPHHCRWCRTNQLDLHVSKALVWRANDPWLSAGLNLAANGLSYVTVGSDAAVMVVAAGKDAPIVIESALVAGIATQAIKLSIDRQRPYAFASGDDPGGDADLSFCSEHTSIAFATAVSAGLVTHKPWVWGVGLGLAGLTGYLRIAGADHWLTDVIAGALVGTIAGWAAVQLDPPSSSTTSTTHVIPLLTRGF